MLVRSLSVRPSVVRPLVASESRQSEQFANGLFVADGDNDGLE